MNRNELLDKIEIIQNNYLGASQAKELADLIEQEKKAECIAFIRWDNTDVKNEFSESIYNDFKQATTK